MKKFPSTATPLTPALCALVLFGLAAAHVQAEIYKWQDDTGKWHFSDVPKGGARVHQASPQATPTTSTHAPTPEEVPSTNNPRAENANLKENLAKKYGTDTLITKVTQAVVAVETVAGSGSGFFISDRGHIITNKHVVRPNDTEEWRKLEKETEIQQEKLQDLARAIEEEKQNLKLMEKELREHRQLLDSEPQNSKYRSQIQREHDQYASNYQYRKSRFDSEQANLQKTKSALDKHIAEMRWKSSMAGVARSFKVYLKDDTVLQANLLQLSPTHDLALLQVEGKITPHLSLAPNTPTSQGEKVYAVGSPLGMRDSVTSGIITRLEKGYIVTDTQILPGNSGGPLINEAGEVIGINTLKRAETSAMMQGFGMAIPAQVVREEWNEYLP